MIATFVFLLLIALEQGVGFAWWQIVLVSSILFVEIGLWVRYIDTTSSQIMKRVDCLEAAVVSLEYVLLKSKT